MVSVLSSTPNTRREPNAVAPVDGIGGFHGEEGPPHPGGLGQHAAAGDGIDDGQALAVNLPGVVHQLPGDGSEVDGGERSGLPDGHLARADHPDAAVSRAVDQSLREEGPLGVEPRLRAPDARRDRWGKQQPARRRVLSRQGSQLPAQEMADQLELREPRGGGEVGAVLHPAAQQLLLPGVVGVQHHQALGGRALRDGQADDQGGGGVDRGGEGDRLADGGGALRQWSRAAGGDLEGGRRPEGAGDCLNDEALVERDGPAGGADLGRSPRQGRARGVGRLAAGGEEDDQ